MEKHNIRVNEFLNLSNEAQFAWIEKNIPENFFNKNIIDFMDHLKRAGFFGPRTPRRGLEGVE